jgi:putative CocE/NonD family hydrolase
LARGGSPSRYRDATATPSLVEPGRVYRYTIDVGATSNVFKQGHRIRVEVSSSNFPRFDRNTNTGQLIAADVAYKPRITNDFSRCAISLSHLTLPIVPR